MRFRLAVLGSAVVAAVLVTVVIAQARLRDDDSDDEVRTATESTAASSTTAPTTTAPATDASILVATTDGRLVVLDQSGAEVREAASATPGPTDSLTFTIAVAPGGDVAYVDRAGDTGCAGAVIERVDLATGISEAVADGEAPAISPDGSKLAYTRCATEGGGFAGVVVRDLESGEEQQWALPVTGKNVVRFLSWAPDSQQLAYVLSLSDNDFPLQEVRLVDTATGGGSLADGRLVYSLPEGIPSFPVTYRGERDQLALAQQGAGGGAELVAVDPADGAVVETLLSVTADQLTFAWSGLAFDAAGESALFVWMPLTATGARAADDLYLWRAGEAAPVQIAEGVTAAAWLP